MPMYVCVLIFPNIFLKNVAQRHLSSYTYRQYFGKLQIYINTYTHVLIYKYVSRHIHTYVYENGQIHHPSCILIKHIFRNVSSEKFRCSPYILTSNCICYLHCAFVCLYVFVRKKMYWFMPPRNKFLASLFLPAMTQKFFSFIILLWGFGVLFANKIHGYIQHYVQARQSVVSTQIFHIDLP